MNIKIFSKACFAVGLLLYSSCGDFLEDYSQDTAYVRGYSDLDELLLGSAYMPTGTPQSIGQDDEYPQIRNPTKVSERCGPNRQECDFSSLD